MSKAYIITDTHFGVYSSHELRKWMNIQFNYFYKELIPFLIDNVKEGDILIHMGDLFDNRNAVPIIVQNKVEELLLEISNILPIHLIVGNHDLYNKGDTSVNLPKLFRHINNINVYEKTHILDKDGKKLVLMPWVEYKKDMIKEIDNNPGDYLFCHSDLNGCRMHLNSIAHRNKDKIDVDNFSKYKRVFSGHIHIRQVQKNFEFIGAPYQMDRNDYNDKKGITILDLDTGDTKFIENKLSPTFKKFKVENDGDLLLLEHLNTDKHFVDIEINNSVLIGKRKNRKILEEQLGKKNFSSVEYINDIIKKKREEEKVNLKEIEIGSGGNDITDMIKEFTSEQDYENTKIKKGVTDVLNDIIYIYEKEHKFKGKNG
jgi:DNA repair exonuclease SbcCD nuclease subunit